MKTILIDAIDTFIVDDAVFTEMQELLDSYPNPKMVVTNADYEEGSDSIFNRLPYPVYTMRHNPDKTDPAYFVALFSHLGLTKDDVVYFEHNPEAVASAQSVGIESYRFDDTKRDLSALKEFLDAAVTA